VDGRKVSEQELMCQKHGLGRGEEGKTGIRLLLDFGEQSEVTKKEVRGGVPKKTGISL
jgi:hypothetical protein